MYNSNERRFYNIIKTTGTDYCGSCPRKTATTEIKNWMYDVADMIDLHISCLENSDTDTLKEIIQSPKQCEFIEKIHSKSAEVLPSCHSGIPMSAEQVVELALFLEKRNPYIIKIVTKATNWDSV